MRSGEADVDNDDVAVADGDDDGESQGYWDGTVMARRRFLAMNLCSCLLFSAAKFMAKEEDEF